MRKISIVIPVINEAETIGKVIKDIPKQKLKKMGYDYEVVVVNTHSTDGTSEIARRLGARVIDEPKRGYGRAYMTGFKAAKGQYIVMIDGDYTYRPEDITRLAKTMEETEADMVLGSRFKGRMEKGAMPFVNLIGNVFLTGIVDILFLKFLTDTHSGIRIFKKTTYNSLGMKCTGMDFASELLLRSIRKGLKIVEIPINYRRRIAGKKKLKVIKDGFGHFKLIISFRLGRE
jgi:glycosyltransferase involved in cell wall biosynthesis